MLFHEIYSAYYNAIAAILKKATFEAVNDKDITEIAKRNAFDESFLIIKDALENGEWPLLDENNRSILSEVPEMPLTTLQKRWLNAIAMDPRMKLFDISVPTFPDVEPLFTPDDILVFDKYNDGDDYESEQYIANFRLIVDAIKNQYPLKFNVLNRNGHPRYFVAQPKGLEYSEKDDKFRVINAGCRYGEIINLGRIVSLKRAYKFFPKEMKPKSMRKASVVFLIKDERNALERVMLHFAHFEKEVERMDETNYRVTLSYEKNDEIEMVIRLLSFGPMVKVIAPSDFVDLMKERLKKQMEYRNSIS